MRRPCADLTVGTAVGARGKDGYLPSRITPPSLSLVGLNAASDLASLIAKTAEVARR